MGMYTWSVVDLPLWRIWVRQLGWWHSRYMEQSKVMFQSPPTRYHPKIGVPQRHLSFRDIQWYTIHFGVSLFQDTSIYKMENPRPGDSRDVIFPGSCLHQQPGFGLSFRQQSFKQEQCNSTISTQYTKYQPIYTRFHTWTQSCVYMYVIVRILLLNFFWCITHIFTELFTGYHHIWYCEHNTW